MWTYWALAFLCVVGISVGQVLFKSAATSFEAAQSIFVLRPMLVLFAALVLYAVTTVGWVFVLSKLSLAKAYPLMALAFIFVPFLSVFVFNEQIGLRHWRTGISFCLRMEKLSAMLLTTDNLSITENSLLLHSILKRRLPR